MLLSFLPWLFPQGSSPYPNHRGRLGLCSRAGWNTFPQPSGGQRSLRNVCSPQMLPLPCGEKGSSLVYRWRGRVKCQCQLFPSPSWHPSIYIPGIQPGIERLPCSSLQPCFAAGQGPAKALSHPHPLLNMSKSEMHCYTIISTRIIFGFIYDCQELPTVPIKCSDSGEFQETWLLLMKQHEKREENFFSALISIWVHVLFYLLFLLILFYVGVVEVGCAHSTACMQGQRSEGNQ